MTPAAYLDVLFDATDDRSTASFGVDLCGSGRTLAATGTPTFNSDGWAFPTSGDELTFTNVTSDPALGISVFGVVKRTPGVQDNVAGDVPGFATSVSIIAAGGVIQFFVGGFGSYDFLNPDTNSRTGPTVYSVFVDPAAATTWITRLTGIRNGLSTGAFVTGVWNTLVGTRSTTRTAAFGVGSALTRVRHQQIHAALTHQFVPLETPQAYQLRVLCDGNSLTHYDVSTDPTDYPNQMIEYLQARWGGGNVEVYDTGVFGQTTAEMASRAAEGVDGFVASPRGNKLHVLVAWEGTNSIVANLVAGMTATQAARAAADDLWAYFDARSNIWRKHTGTCLARGLLGGIQASFNAARLLYNGYLADEAADHGVTVVDIASAIGTDPTNPNFGVDETHFSTLGKRVAGYTFGAAVLAARPTPVTKTLTWSLPEDRTGGTTADGAMKSGVTVDEENDVRLVFNAVGAAALAEDLTDWTLEAEVAPNTAAAPVAAPTVTVVSATSFEVTFAATAANNLPPEVYVLSVKRVDTGARTDMVRKTLTVRATAFNPP